MNEIRAANIMLFLTARMKSEGISTKKKAIWLKDFFLENQHDVVRYLTSFYLQISMTMSVLDSRHEVLSEAGLG